jgi:hypothetical protein
MSAAAYDTIPGRKSLSFALAGDRSDAINLGIPESPRTKRFNVGVEDHSECDIMILT